GPAAGPGDRARVPARRRRRRRHAVLLRLRFAHRRSQSIRDGRRHDRDRPRTPGQALSFSRNRSLTTRGSALPSVAFITWPTKKPSRPSLPLRYAATWPAFAAITSSTIGSSAETSLTVFCAR